MKYFLIAGEASGDLHASRLMETLRKKDPKAEFKFLGGDLMAVAAGTSPQKHYQEMNFMGFADVLANIRKLSRILQSTKKAISEWKPDVVILVDYAGFNLKVAKFASDKGLRVFYYITPKVWAWRKKRIKLLERYVDRLFVILPFEAEFFRQNGLEAEYHGNPLIDAVSEFRKHPPVKSKFLEQNGLEDRPIIALLAGSRKQEIQKCLPEMVRAVKYFPGYQFVVAGAPVLDKVLYDQYLDGTGIRLVQGETYPLLLFSEAAVVTSGTATLEAALFKIPQVVIYKTGGLTYRIGKLFITFRFFSLVNLILGKELVKEFLQIGLERKIRDELTRILEDKDHRSKILRGYEQVEELIGTEGSSERTAERMLKLLEE